MFEIGDLNYNATNRTTNYYALAHLELLEWENRRCAVFSNFQDEDIIQIQFLRDLLV